MNNRQSNITLAPTPPAVTGDRHHLYDAARLLAFELGLRFFQDYLAGDLYFKVHYPEQNLQRARVQFHLCESIEAQETAIRHALQRTWEDGRL